MKNKKSLFKIIIPIITFSMMVLTALGCWWTTTVWCTSGNCTISTPDCGNIVGIKVATDGADVWVQAASAFTDRLDVNLDCHWSCVATDCHNIQVTDGPFKTGVLSADRGYHDPENERCKDPNFNGSGSGS